MRPLFFVYIFLCLLPLLTRAQTIPVTRNYTARYNQLLQPLNFITNAQDLDSFFYSLHRLKNNPQQKVSIVHIGDSHIQGDFMTAILRQGLQNYFGNAGRGLVFPQRLAKSNAPLDIISSSTNTWSYNRLVYTKNQPEPGITGFAISTNNNIAQLSLGLKDEEKFSAITLITDADRENKWSVSTAGATGFYRYYLPDSSHGFYTYTRLDSPVNNITISSLPTAHTKSFYGALLHNNTGGVLVHTIGVNGARYDHYNQSGLFWQQLPLLQADLYIVSLGTNEAQAASFNELLFKENLDVFIQKIKALSPQASILITTAPDSYKLGKSNMVLRQLNSFLTAYCNSNNISLYNLYQVGGGYGSAYRWIRSGSINRDRVHYTVEGYRVHGELLWQAIANRYNSLFPE
jgi:lysophospholipase L1-like esterase